VNAILLPPARTYIPVSEITDPEAAIRALGFLTPSDDAKLRAVEAASFFLVRNDGPEKWRCARCNGRHAYYTSFCIDRPWKGLREALYGYWRNVGAQHEADLTPGQRQRMRVLSQAFGPGDPAQSLHQSHPRTAHAMGTRETDTDRGAEVLGTLEPILPARARLLANQINTRARSVLIRL
jgi:hypothetical protein